MESYQTDCKLDELKNNLSANDPLESLKKDLQNKTDEPFNCPWDNHQGDISYFR
jgi:hypothetical protein